MSPELEYAKERFWRRVDLHKNPIHCWNWKGEKTLRGYGLFGRPKRRYAHRFAWETFHGPIEVGLEIDHLCRNPSCVNPTHLEPVTHQMNMERSPVLGLQVADYQRLKTHCPRGHPLSGDNLVTRRRTHRECKICANELRRLRRAMAK